MSVAYYVSHPEVRIDPAIPVPEWSLSAHGRERLQAVATERWVTSLTRIASSGETKALETAAMLAAASGAPIDVHSAMGENDRSATGFLPPSEFETTAGAFFANPQMSVRGWERAVDAQARIVRAISTVLDAHDPTRPIAFSGHGGVGTLLFCYLAGLPIDRRHDQNGGGNVIAIDLATRKPLFSWVPVEAVADTLSRTGIAR